MSIIRRCDNCRTESNPPNLFSEEQDDWFALFVPGEDSKPLNFCEEKCVTDYFLSKSLIDEVS